MSKVDSKEKRHQKTDQSRKCDFSISEWSSQYSHLANAYPPNQIVSISKRAALMFNPTQSSIECCAETRKVIFYLLVAHFVEVEKQIQSGNQMIGGITSVSEGSISVSTSGTGGKDNIPTFLSQTRYGIEYWEMTKKYRTFFYKRPFPDRRNRLYL